MKNSHRIALLGSAITASTILASAPAQAACTVAPNAVTCATTTTTDTTNAGGTPASDRNYPVDTSAAAFTGTVSTGAVVDGYGLAFTNTVGGTNALNVVNNGAIQVNAGNTPTQGINLGQAGLNILGIGATPINYSGTGSITNLGGGFGDGLDMTSAGTGNITANVGGNITAGSATTGAASYGIGALQSGTAGNVSITTATGTTIRAGDSGINARVGNAASTGTLTVTNGASILSRTGAPNTLLNGIRAVNAGLGSVTVANTGAIGSATDRVGQGIQATITNGANAAAVTVTGSGAIWATGAGINASTTGTGSVTVNYTGAVNTTGPTGVLVGATTGASTVTLGNITAATDAVSVTSTGAQTITLNGVTTGTAGSGLVSTTTGARTIAVGAGGNVTGGTQAILLAGTGATTMTNAGTIGAASTGLALNAAAAGAVTLTNTGTINGRLTFSTGADTFSNSGTFNTQGTTDFGAGVDVLNNNAAGTINLTGATTLANLETFNQNGRVNLNTFTLTGPPIAFNNAGTLTTTGSAGLAGFTTLSNSGTMTLAAGTLTVPAVTFTNLGTINATSGATTITGQTNFANSGTLNLQDGAPNDVLTINSNFVGTGGSRLLVDFNNTAADRLVINGAASGSTTVNAQALGLGLFNVPGFLVVDAATSSPSAFILGSVTGNTSPLVDYRLVQIGADYFLTASPNPAAFDPVAIGNLATSIWYQSADEVIAETDQPAVTVGPSVWGHGYYSQDKYGDSNDSAFIGGTRFDVDNRVKTRRMGIQAGVDYGFGGARVGLTGGYGEAKAKNDLSSRLKATGYNIGLYGQFGGYTGFHGSALVKYDRYKLRFTNGFFEGEGGHLKALGIDGSLGYRFGFSETATIDAKVGLSHVRTKLDDINAFGLNYDFGRSTSTRGRAGLRATFGGSLSPYVDATVYHEFNGRHNVRLFDGLNFYDIDSGGKGTWARLEGGITGNGGPGPILAAWADLGDKRGFGLRAGYRFGGRAVEEVLPPPPPPPPAPPATQTCPDGSVILATDACPLPPPPPPPPPPEPERG